jgi:peptide deformylase
MIRIVSKEDPILHKEALPVPIEEIKSEKISKIINNMKIAMHREKDGIAIAAPQIGEPYQIFVINAELLRQADPTFKGEKDLVYINPVITKLSREKKEVDEGCLSVRWIYGKVKRSVRASVKAINENGEPFERGASGILAQIFQHEIDHLHGILFIEKTKKFIELTEEEIRQMEKDDSKK